MDVRIGVIQTAREIELQLADDTDVEELRGRVEEVLGDDERVLWLTDKKGRQVAVPGGKIAYVDIGARPEGRSFGFSS